MVRRSKWEGWGECAVEASIVAGIGVTLAYLGVGDLIGRGIQTVTKNVIPRQLAAPVATGVIIFATEFIYSLVVMYKNE